MFAFTAALRQQRTSLASEFRGLFYALLKEYFALNSASSINRGRCGPLENQLVIEMN